MLEGDPEQHNDPAYWRKRAEKARLRASKLSDPVAKQVLLQIASSYDELAAMAAKGLLQQPSS
jgi:hypothetical protein